jgi:PRC-barrel domain
MHSQMRAGFIIAVAASLISSTVIAQTVQPKADPTIPGVTGTKLMTQEAAGQWRGSKLIGLNVYNDDNEKIGGITELIVDKSGKLDAVVVGAGGFLGLGCCQRAPISGPRRHQSNEGTAQSRASLQIFPLNGAKRSSAVSVTRAATSEESGTLIAGG